MEELDKIIFYSIDKAIRTYRQFAQTQLRKNGFEMTVDQWIVMKCILVNPEITQQEIAEKVFKDTASVTRIITLLVKAKYLTRKTMLTNRRRVVLKVTPFGLETLDRMEKIILQNREVALNEISQEDINLVKKVMDKIAENCK